MPVAWRPWGDAAAPLTEAARAGKPVLLSIGTAWDQGSRQMDLNVYSDPEIAEQINANFIPVRVDADDRPDILRRYRAAATALGGQPGLPVTAFLTPAGDAFMASTTFAAAESDDEKQPGFGELLKALAEAYGTGKEKGNAPEKICEQAAQLASEIQSAQQRLCPGGQTSAANGTATATATATGPDDLQAALHSVCARLLEAGDQQHGGISGLGNVSGKIPPLAAVELALERGVRADDEALLRFAQTTLFRLLEGGVHDHVGGGFHHSSVDETWRLPRFEKPAATNGEIIRVLSLAAAVLRGHEAAAEPAIYLDAIAGAVSYLLDTLGDSGGGFFVAQSAQSGMGEPGGLYVWTLAELEQLLTEDELAALTLRFDLRGLPGDLPGDEHSEKNVLAARLPVEAVAAKLGRDAQTVREQIATALVSLRAVRSSRPMPYIDTSLFTWVQGAVCRGLLTAVRERCLDEDLSERALAAALQTLDRVLDEARDRSVDAEERLALVHRFDTDDPEQRGAGQLADHVHIMTACADAFECTGRAKYLQAALRLAAHVQAAFADAQAGVLRDVATGPGPACYPLEDEVGPADNALAAQTFLRLAEIAGDEDLRERARRLTAALIPAARALGHHACGAALAFAYHGQGRGHVQKPLRE